MNTFICEEIRESLGFDRLQVTEFGSLTICCFVFFNKKSWSVTFSSVTVLRYCCMFCGNRTHSVFGSGKDTPSFSFAICFSEYFSEGWVSWPDHWEFEICHSLFPLLIGTLHVLLIHLDQTVLVKHRGCCLNFKSILPRHYTCV